MKYVETCPCGARFEVEATGWGVRSLDVAAPLGEWRRLHVQHIRDAHTPRRNGPTRAQLDHFRHLKTPNNPTNNKKKDNT